MFADTKCFHAINNIGDACQQDLDSISTWASNDQLTFQPTKCENLRITRKRSSTKRSCPRANGAKRRARVLIPHGYLQPGKGKHSEV